MGNLSSSGSLPHELDYVYSSLTDLNEVSEVLTPSSQISMRLKSLFKLSLRSFLQINDWHSTCSELEELSASPPGVNLDVYNYIQNTPPGVN